MIRFGRLRDQLHSRMQVRSLYWKPRGPAIDDLAGVALSPLTCSYVSGNKLTCFCVAASEEALGV